jgi:eukaryotic-like serine/threonine-protein kinase
MNQELWRRVEEIFHAALERAPEARAAFLDGACSEDADLRRQVELLLVKQEQAGSFLEIAAVEDLTVTATASLLGRQFGPYRIVSPLGAGGMGEVYRAHDNKLGRDVAIKTLPAEFARDPERLARFRREARTLASLNHPNIAAIYGLETGGGLEESVDCLVLELVEGETLRGPLPLDKALEYARQIAEALEAAHEKGIIHRDLKPNNVKVTPQGRVKVLDFGLAKAIWGPEENQDLSQLATVTNLESSLTGRVLGTPGYMSPEQAQGRPVDKRADIWAFGCVLYELLTGKRAFRGETLQDTIAAVLEREPDWQALPAKTPAKIRELLRQCLQKAAGRRLQTIADARRTIEEAQRGWNRWRLAAIAAAALAVLAAGAVWFLKPKSEPPLLQVEITPPEGAKFVNTISPFALSPDGRRIVFLATGKDGKPMLWSRSIDSSSAVALAGTENPNGPFWSPDSRWVGFSAYNKLQKVDVVGGGQPQVICEIEGRAGGTWNSEGVIVFPQGGKPLQRVSAAGGTPVPILSFDAAREETYQAAPYFLPDGRHLVYWSAGGQGDNTMLASLDGRLKRILLPNVGVVTYAPDPRGGGSILYWSRGQLLARPLDLDKLEFTGPPAVIADSVGDARWWSASANGLLAFRHFYRAPNQFTWVSRDGHSINNVGDPSLLYHPRISPDQKTLAFSRQSVQNLDEIWTLDLNRNISTRFTLESEYNIAPVWSSDGKSIVYASERNGARVFVERPANGIGPETIVVNEERSDFPTAISHDGRWLVFAEATPLHSMIALRSRQDPSKVIRVQGRGVEVDGSISPNGRWLLYSSIPAARREVLVQSVPKEAGGSFNGVGKWQISTAGGSQPVWRADGKEIFYVAPDGMMMAVAVESGENFSRPGAPKPLFQTRLVETSPWDTRQYDVTPDGQRFLLNQRSPDSPDAPITVVFNWPKLLQK